MSKLDAKPAQPTYTELERAAVHDAKAVLAGEEECECRTCKKVRAAEDKGRSV